eukprot:gnl/TRDRNA2_/TRDRNA2_170292_c0_seq1.p1 gnl/TRDRNA2_/TRDRNA2_170292_c0~~gnl/TRDRNA2_/TRDRNA2_170292_c0_seq1.p1  ORF type:complete len:145 (+),score=27.33 gnl/TRDRNA2_/TRDRNA2_170292_c0_seq1:119-553(+)
MPILNSGADGFGKAIGNALTKDHAALHGRDPVVGVDGAARKKSQARGAQLLKKKTKQIAHVARWRKAHKDVDSNAKGTGAAAGAQPVRRNDVRALVANSVKGEKEKKEPAFRLKGSGGADDDDFSEERASIPTKRFRRRRRRRL